MNRLHAIATLASLVLLAHPRAGVAAEALPWPQFRGPNGQGLAPEVRLPVRFGPETNVHWKTEVPAGHSSPIVSERLVFLTALDPDNERNLATLAFDRATGRLAWRRTITSESKSAFHALNNPASSTPAADAQRVYVYFGTFGMVCYDHAGQEVWRRILATPPSKYGMGTSPILHGDAVILALDGDQGKSRLIALRRDTGETLWEEPRPLFRAGWSTPMIFRHDAAEELVVLGSKRLTAYDPANGHEIWWAGGFPDETVGVPVAGDGLLFVGAAALGGRGDEKTDAAVTWKSTVAEFDRNHDNRIQREEMTAGFGFIQRPELPKSNPGYAMPISDMNAVLRIFDADKDGTISEDEWMKTMAGFEAHSLPYLAAFRPGARGDAKPTHIAWDGRRGIPETPSLLFAHGRLFLLRDGGLLTCLKASAGTELFRERLGAAGQYVASPIAAGNHLLAASVAGMVTVIEMADELRVLARNDFGEEIYATPALAGNSVFVRTTRHLYSLGE